MSPDTHGSSRRPWLFFLLVYLASWSAWTVAGSGTAAIPHAIATALRIAGFASVAVIAIALAYGSRDARLIREFRRCNFDPRRVSPAGCLLAILLMPALSLLAIELDAIRSQASVQLSPAVVVGLPALVKAYAFSWILGPIVEEMGWRGYALAPLQSRYGIRGGALVVACVHALWHLPMFLIVSGDPHGAGVAWPAFWWFMLDIVSLGLVAAALFNRMGASAIVAMLVHGSFNASSAIWVLTPDASQYRHVLIAAAGVLAALAGGSDRAGPESAIRTAPPASLAGRPHSPGRNAESSASLRGSGEGA